MTTRPCAHPQCDTDNGQPALTSQGMCDPCTRRYHRLLDWLHDDYTLIATTMPQPTPHPTAHGAAHTRRTDGYYHPRQWASDTLTTIADVFHTTETAFREDHHLPPSPDPHHARETFLVAHGHHTLTTRIHDVAAWEPVGVYIEDALTVHNRIRATLGLTRHRLRLTGVPCMRCEQFALVKEERTLWSTGPHPDLTKMVRCENCGHETPEQRFGLLARHIADAELDAYLAARDTPTPGSLTPNP